MQTGAVAQAHGTSARSERDKQTGGVLSYFLWLGSCELGGDWWIDLSCTGQGRRCSQAHIAADMSTGIGMGMGTGEGMGMGMIMVMVMVMVRSSLCLLIYFCRFYKAICLRLFHLSFMVRGRRRLITYAPYSTV